MKKLNKVTGALGETLATNFLKEKKYKILETNFKNKLGEIDIIARYKKTIVFVEVKTRTTEAFGLPCEAVDKRKQEKIHIVAESYLKLNHLEEREIRFDVIEVLDGEINHIIGCF